jgi:uncharacterized NAD-dependent epimerase/dehydratase family protein
MLKRTDPLALLLEDDLGRTECKMAIGIVRYAENPITCVVDSANGGSRLSEFFDLPRDCPVVGSVDEAKKAGAQVVVIGTAPSGGLIPESYYGHLDRAVEIGLSLVNGLHDKLGPRYPHLHDGQWIWDIRTEPAGIGVAQGRAATLRNRRLLMIGTDMAVGKMTAGLEVYKEAVSRGIKSEFIATGQIGIVIMGKGVPLDAVKVDYACDAMEKAVMDAAEAELIIVEGQGSLVHPGSTSTLPLMRGTCPTDLILCHRAGQNRLKKVDHIPIPPLRDLIRLYEDLAATCGIFPRPRTAGIALNTGHLPLPEAEHCIQETKDETGLPVTDVLRYGAGVLVDHMGWG